VQRKKETGRERESAGEEAKKKYSTATYTYNAFEKRREENASHVSKQHDLIVMMMMTMIFTDYQR